MPAVNAYISILEAVDRKVRATSTGIEIQTTFYVEPATGAPLIISALLGATRSDATGNSRRMPAADFQYPFCYCVEARETPLDRRAAASGPSLLSSNINVAAPTFPQLQAALTQPIVLNGPWRSATPTRNLRSAACAGYTSRPSTGRCPRSTIRQGRIPILATAQPENAFDYVDPQFYPCSRSFPANGVPGSRTGSSCKTS